MDEITAITLRDYRPGDWQAMHALDLQCFAPPFRFTRRAMRRFAETPGTITLLAESFAESNAESNGQLAGFCIVHIEQHVGYIVTLDVAPAYRRQGLAQRLMVAAEVRAHAAGATAMALHVFTGNTAAIRFYQRLGYQQMGTTRSFYGPGLDALVYRKQFA